MDNTSGIRINKFLSEAGLCSRREADRMVEQGRVTINGKQPSTGQRVQRRDKVRVDGRDITNNQQDAVYLAFNKPIGIVTTTDGGDRANIVDYVNYPQRIFPVGRLDKDSEGLIFLTNDGDIVNKILRAGNEHDKEYEVTVDKVIDEKFIETMGHGVPILGQVTKKCKVEKIAAFTFRITLNQGLNRQIRRMCEHLGFEVKKLKRTRIMHISLDVPSGQWREFTTLEIEEMERLLASSSKTQKPSKKGNSSPNKKPAPQASKPKAGSKGARSGSAPPKGRKTKATAPGKKTGSKRPATKSSSHSKGRKR